MQTVWHGEVRGQRGQATKWAYQGEQRQSFATGAEIGRFNMGSTVIVLLPRDTAHWSETVTPGSEVRMGEAIGQPHRRG
jgi:phosphatidylserine decarboxylase